MKNVCDSLTLQRVFKVHIQKHGVRAIIRSAHTQCAAEMLYL